MGHGGTVWDSEGQCGTVGDCVGKICQSVACFVFFSTKNKLFGEKLTFWIRAFSSILGEFCH